MKDQTGPITYDLRDTQNSDAFYQKIAGFSAKVGERARADAGDYIKRFMDYLNDRKVEPLRSIGEYAVEILTYGLVWKRYAGAAYRTPGFVLGVFSVLYQLRSRYQRLKPLIDRLRGLLSGVFLVPGIGKPLKNKAVNLKVLKRLLKWMGASGDFKGETKRLQNWYNFFLSQDASVYLDFHNKAVSLFLWFKAESTAELGIYTEALSGFMRERYKDYRWREDAIFCGKERVEYHLNMVASELMNWGLSDSYKKTEVKVVLVPGCMRNPPVTGCQSKHVDGDLQCVGCNAECSVGKIYKTGENEGFKVYIVLHTSSFTKWLKRWQNNENTGVVAIACLLNIAPGGYEIREMKIPSQCVILDYCGCKNHWDEKGIPTSVNTNRLLSILKNNPIPWR